MSDALNTTIDKKKRLRRIFLSGYRVNENSGGLSAQSENGYDEEEQYCSEDHELSSGSDYL
jgi:hypothetical protein